MKSLYIYCIADLALSPARYVGDAFTSRFILPRLLPSPAGNLSI